MEDKSAFQATIINVKGFFLLMILIMGSGTALTVIIASYGHNMTIAAAGIFIFWLGPTLVFQKRLRKLFTKEVTVSLQNEKCSIEIFNARTNELERIDENKFNDIRTFKIIKSAKDNSSFLKFNFKNGKYIAYTFLGQDNESVNDNIVDQVLKYIHAYNSSKDEAETIKLTPSFFSSRSGTCYVAALTTILIAGIILQSIFKPATIPITLFAGIFLYLQIITQRKRDISDLKKFEQK